VRELLAIERTLDHMAQSEILKPTQWTTLWWLTFPSQPKGLHPQAQEKELLYGPGRWWRERC
jgi:hypothetical protein